MVFDREMCILCYLLTGMQTKIDKNVGLSVRAEAPVTLLKWINSRHLKWA